MTSVNHPGFTGEQNSQKVSLMTDKKHTPSYTAEFRARRDPTRWTLVQGLLAPAQFLTFVVSLGLVLRFVATGAGDEAATLAILVKTGALYLIMVTGTIWEKIVFGQHLFAPAFFWGDVFSFAVIALHTACIINARQFLLKLRAARLQAEMSA